MSVKKSNHLLFLVSLAIGLIAFVSDQAIKLYVLKHFANAYPHKIQVISGLNLTLVWNNGISFGLLSGEMSRFLLPILTAIIITFLCTYFARKKNNHIMISPGISLIIGGAIGNMMDRFYYGAVVDYIDVYFKNYHFPTFNLADSYIFIGAVFLILFDQKNLRQNARSK